MYGVFRRFLQKAQTKLIKFSFFWLFLPHKLKNGIMWTFLAAEEPALADRAGPGVQKANLAEAVNKIVNMDFSTLFGSLIRESL